MVRSMARLNEPIYERPTVNILNVPLEENHDDYIHIKKHFELPVSAGTTESAQGYLLKGRQSMATTQYADNVSSRAAITA